jgi:hypothetical protein
MTRTKRLLYEDAMRQLAQVHPDMERREVKRLARLLAKSWHEQIKQGKLTDPVFLPQAVN